MRINDTSMPIPSRCTDRDVRLNATCLSFSVVFWCSATVEKPGRSWLHMALPLSREIDDR